MKDSSVGLLLASHAGNPDPNPSGGFEPVREKYCASQLDT